MLVLDVKPGGRYLDGTLGGGTHTEELLIRSSPDGRVLSLDIDSVALARARERLSSFASRWIGVEENFRRLDQAAAANGMVPLDGVLLDLGLSSDELVDPSKGLSFLQDGPLDMRLGPKANDDGLTAAEIVNSWDRADIEAVLRRFGEEKFASRIAKNLIETRKIKMIVKTSELVAIVRASVPASYEQGRIHPATRTFQALRMVVNDELEGLQEAVAAAHRVLRPGGRLAIISFHSLEDRVVKTAFADGSAWKTVIKKPISPTAKEVTENPRSRSAKLRAVEKRSNR